MGWEMGRAGGRCVVGADLEVVGGVGDCRDQTQTIVLFWHFVCVGVRLFEPLGGGMGREMGRTGGRCVVGQIWRWLGVGDCRHQTETIVLSWHIVHAGVRPFRSLGGGVSREMRGEGAR